MLTPQDLVRRHRAGLVLDGDPGPDGVPREPVTWLDLSGAVPDVAALVTAARAAFVPTVGVATGPVPPELLQVLDLTIAPGGDRRTVTEVDVDLVRQRCAASPLAVVTLGRLLRQTEVLDVRDALAAESAAYSVLLAGPERARLLAPRPPRAKDVEPRVRLALDRDVLRVTLCRPDRRNRVDAQLRDELCSALSLALGAPERDVVLTAEGDDFSTGGDLDEFGSLPDVATAHVVRQARSVGWLLHALGPRASAVVQGRCLGSGIELPAFCARVQAGEGFRASLPELGFGLVPGAGGTVSVTRRIGRWRTFWMVLTGEPVDGARALEWGLVDEVGA